MSLNWNLFSAVQWLLNMRRRGQGLHYPVNWDGNGLGDAAVLFPWCYHGEGVQVQARGLPGGNPLRRSTLRISCMFLIECVYLCVFLTEILFSSLDHQLACSIVCSLRKPPQTTSIPFQLRRIPTSLLLPNSVVSQMCSHLLSLSRQ